MSSSDMKQARCFLQDNTVSTTSASDSWLMKYEERKDKFTRDNQDRKAYAFLLMVRRFIDGYRDSAVVKNEEQILKFLTSNPDFK